MTRAVDSEGNAPQTAIHCENHTPWYMPAQLTDLRNLVFATERYTCVPLRRTLSGSVCTDSLQPQRTGKPIRYFRRHLLSKPTPAPATSPHALISLVNNPATNKFPFFRFFFLINTARNQHRSIREGNCKDRLGIHNYTKTVLTTCRKSGTS